MAKIYYHGFALIENDNFAINILAKNDNLTIGLLGFALYTFIHIRAYGHERKVVAKTNLRTNRRNDFARKLEIFLRCRKLLRSLETQLLASIILLAIVDTGMLNRTCNAGLPILEIGTIESLRTISKDQLQDTAESALVATNTQLLASRNDSISPPARSNLHREGVAFAHLLHECIGDVVGKRNLCLCRVCITRLEEIATNDLAIKVELVDTQTCGHPLCRDNSLLVLDS